MPFTKLVSVFLVRVCALICAMCLLAACSSNEDDPETQIIKQLEYLEDIAEQKDVSTLFSYVDDNYGDNKGFDKRKLATLLRFRLLNQQSVHVFSTVSSVDILDETNAHAVVYAGVGGTKVEQVEELADVGMKLMRASLALKRDGDKWIVQTSVWHSASVDELLE